MDDYIAGNGLLKMILNEPLPTVNISKNIDENTLDLI